jgi:hypothetical protein
MMQQQSPQCQEEGGVVERVDRVSSRPSNLVVDSPDARANQTELSNELLGPTYTSSASMAPPNQPNYQGDCRERSERAIDGSVGGLEREIPPSPPPTPTTPLPPSSTTTTVTTPTTTMVETLVARSLQREEADGMEPDAEHCARRISHERPPSPSRLPRAMNYMPPKHMQATVLAAKHGAFARHASVSGKHSKEVVQGSRLGSAATSAITLPPARFQQEGKGGGGGRGGVVTCFVRSANIPPRSQTSEQASSHTAQQSGGVVTAITSLQVTTGSPRCTETEESRNEDGGESSAEETKRKDHGIEQRQGAPVQETSKPLRPESSSVNAQTAETSKKEKESSQASADKTASHAVPELSHDSSHAPDKQFRRHDLKSCLEILESGSQEWKIPITAEEEEEEEDEEDGELISGLMDVFQLQQKCSDNKVQLNDAYKKLRCVFLFIFF